MIHDDNAVTALAEAVARVGRHRFPIVMTDTVRAFLDEVSDALGIELDPDDPEAAIAKLGTDRADHRLDHPQHRQPDPAGRRLQGQRHPEPGQRDHRLPDPARPARERSWTSCARWSARTSRSRSSQRQPPLETTFDGALVDAMARGAAGRGPGRAAGAVHALRRHRRQGVRPAGHPLLRVRAAAPAARPELLARCSTASTSGCRSRDYSSACACSTGCSATC